MFWLRIIKTYPTTPIVITAARTYLEIFLTPLTYLSKQITPSIKRITIAENNPNVAGTKIRERTATTVNKI